MKRCNHKFCTLIADAASKTCWLEAEDIPDPVKLLRLIVEDPGAVVLPATVMVEAKKFLQKFEEIDSPELSGEHKVQSRTRLVSLEKLADEDDEEGPVEVTDIHNFANMPFTDEWSVESVITQSGEGEA